MSRRSLKGLLGLVLLDAGAVLIVNSIIDLMETETA